MAYIGWRRPRGGSSNLVRHREGSEYSDADFEPGLISKGWPAKQYSRHAEAWHWGRDFRGRGFCRHIQGV